MSKNLYCNTRDLHKKLFRAGATSLSDDELLAILLGTSSESGKNQLAVDNLLSEFKSLRGIFAAPRNDVSRVAGLGDARYARLATVSEINSRLLVQEIADQKKLLSSPHKVKSFLRTRLRNRSREVLLCIFLNNHNRLLAVEELFEGTLDCAYIHPREVLLAVLRYKATAIILAHNHPSGQPEPSEADKQITHKIGQALKLIDVQLLDHFVIGANEIVSFSERGMM